MNGALDTLFYRSYTEEGGSEQVNELVTYSGRSVLVLILIYHGESS